MDNPILIEAVRRAAERRAERERSDPVELARRCGIEPDKWQAEVLRSKARQMILCCSRQSGKSTVTAVLSLHQAIHYPGSLILMLAPSWRQSAELFLKVKGLLAHLPNEAELVEAESGLRIEFTNGSRILSLPGAEATVRGFSDPALIVIDEAARVSDGLYYAIKPMLAISHGRLVLLSTPWGRRGAFWSVWDAGGDSWERFKVTAYDCPRISAEWLEAERQSMGELFFRSEYEVEFSDAIDNVFRSEHIEAALVDNLKPVAWWDYGQ